MSRIFRFIPVLIIAAVFAQCSTSKPIKSAEDLKEAFNIESTSAEKYGKYAQTALAEGYDTLAQLFKAASKSESIQASNEERILKKYGESGVTVLPGNYEIKSTYENLQATIKGETYEIQTVYPRFIRDAEHEKAPEAARSFTWACDAQKKLLKYFRYAGAVINKGNETNLPFTWLVCPTCGNTCNSTDVKGKCDFCLTKQENFFGYIGNEEGELKETTN